MAMVMSSSVRLAKLPIEGEPTSTWAQPAACPAHQTGCGTAIKEAPNSATGSAARET